MEAITRVQAMALFRLKKSPRKPIVSCPIIAPIKITLPERGKMISAESGKMISAES